MLNKNEKAERPSVQMQLTSSILNEEEFGADILRVREINKMMHIKEAPNSLSSAEGVNNLQGRIIRLVDLKSKASLKERKYDETPWNIFTEIIFKVIGFIVDKANGILGMPKKITEVPTQIIEGIETGYISADGKLEDMIIIQLDLNKILNSERMELLGSMN